MAFAIFIYKTAKKFPDFERFGLYSQITRATISISANIAEGCGRQSSKEFLRFLSIALGSSAEVENFLELGYRLEYISLEDYESANFSNDEIRRMIKSIISTINKKLSD